jgi:hypothetical protein
MVLLPSPRTERIAMDFIDRSSACASACGCVASLAEVETEAADSAITADAETRAVRMMDMNKRLLRARTLASTGCGSNNFSCAQNAGRPGRANGRGVHRFRGKRISA